jgi:hypothetical protein
VAGPWVRHLERNELAWLENNGLRFDQPKIELTHVMRQIFDHFNLCGKSLDRHGGRF